MSYNKYGNRWTEYDGKNYQSKKEAGRAQELDILKNGSVIRDWKGQIRMPIEVNGEHIAYYICDFEIQENDGSITYEDVKGYKRGAAYEMFKLKKKLIEAQYKIKIKEV